MKPPFQTVIAGTLAALIAAAPAAPAQVTVSEVWTRRYDGPANKREYPGSLAIDPAGNVVISGTSWNEDGSSETYTAKYAAGDGALLWERRHNRQQDGSMGTKAMTLDRGGNVVVAGYSNNGSQYDYRISKFASADGRVLWERFQSAGVGDPWPTPIAVDTDGHIVAAYRASEGPGFHVDKFAAADGARLWQRRFEDASGSLAVVYDLTLDAGGDVVLCGSYQGESSKEIVATAKYAAATGALVWENRWEPAGDYNWPTAAVVDGMGNAVVIAISVDARSGFHRGQVMKHAAADGSIIWETHLPEDPMAESTTSCDPMDVEIDSADNVFVTSSMITENPQDNGAQFPVHTVKFAAADGARLWEQRHIRQHAEELIDNPGGIAVDSFGNVVMWGWLFSAVYAAEDGAVLWESPSDSQPNWPIVYSRSLLATGPRGMIAILGQIGGDFATTVYRQGKPFTSFPTWAAGFGLADLAPASDSDADGLPSAVEYVLGQDPSLAAPHHHLVATVENQTWILRFNREDNSETPDCTLAIEIGTELGAWPATYVIGKNSLLSSSGVDIQENGTAPDTITLNLPLGAGTRYFARLAVTIAP